MSTAAAAEAPTMNHLTTATPVEIDTALAEIHGRGYAAEAKVAQVRRWVTSYAKGLEKAQTGDPRYGSYTTDYLEGLESDLRDAEAEAREVWAETRPYDAEYARRGGWFRAYLVDNSNGHVHRSRECRTCYDTTEFVWLPELSDATEEFVVEQAGALTCLECFPNVSDKIRAQRPTELVENPAKRKAKAERDAAKAARDEKARIAGITDAETGGELRVKWLSDSTEVLKTLRTARTWLTDHYAPYGSGNAADDVAKVVAAIAAKEGKDEATVIAEAKARAAKRR